MMIMAFSYGILEGEVLMTSLAASVQNDTKFRMTVIQIIKK